MKKLCKKCGVEKSTSEFQRWKCTCHECRNLDRRAKYYPSSCLYCKKDFRPGVKGRYKYCTEVCRFMEKVEANDKNGCWIWKAGKRPDGYGEFVPIGKRSGLAHRESYRIFKGPIKDKMFILHSCHNPSCVNPDHLRQGTNKDNVHDMLKAKRNKQPSGENSGMSKLTSDIVQNIREKFKEGMSYAALGRLFNISAVQASNIVRRVSWKHI